MRCMTFICATWNCGFFKMIIISGKIKSIRTFVKFIKLPCQLNAVLFYHSTPMENLIINSIIINMHVSFYQFLGVTLDSFTDGSAQSRLYSDVIVHCGGIHWHFQRIDKLPVQIRRQSRHIWHTTANDPSNVSSVYVVVYVLFISPVANVINPDLSETTNLVSFHQYADDTQLYIGTNASTLVHQVASIESCTQRVHNQWRI